MSTQTASVLLAAQARLEETQRAFAHAQLAFQQPAASATFDSSPEGVHIHQLVGDGVACVNQIVTLLKPKADTPNSAHDSIERTYSPVEIGLFESLTTHAVQAFTDASQSSTNWFTSLSNQISTNFSQQAALQQQSNDADHEVKNVEAQMNSQVERSKQLAEKLAKDNDQVRISLDQLHHAQDELQARKDEQERIRIAFYATCWIPFVGLTLAIIDMTAEQNAVNGAQDASNRSREESEQDGRVLAQTRDQINALQAQMSQAQSKRLALQLQIANITSQKQHLESVRDQLTFVKTDVFECLHTVDQVLVSAKVLDNMMSLSNFASAVKSLEKALAAGDGFAGELALLDDAAFKALDAAIVRIRSQSRNKIMA